ncbi:metallophosphoesterase [Flavobacterium aquatile]|uniref:Metallophosphatase n=1 Tax=Flavobacterium aquatile LMG 4008 = ATCC 11947 TaxID=1453498 RepID=A0A095SR60_9FLAO|nr:metallophosphoesterase [Flavobacterium aquatile]KGD67062.1 metallophosphatase [Flavobacterium aquatile LMG 4008 = ATCC 11947]OXA66777.1 serine/threonine protein phosphatase [Flavobacterium aquatile LMG 4008 = ATCC 11947]GEC78356.1 metallophosphatase [Flavobacterium aquatile]
MSRTLVIGDIHGGLRALHQIIERANVTLNDTLIFLGDYVDGWSQSPDVIDYLIKLNEHQSCIFIRGNHDELLLDWLQNKNENIDEGMWFKHGGEATVIAYSKVSQSTINKHIAFLKSLENYYLDDQNRLFIHAGFTNMNGINYEYFPKLFYWDRTLWETALALDKTLELDNVYYPRRFTLYKEIYIGHTPVTKIGETIPIQKACVWNVDTGAAFKGPLTVMDVDTKQFWQSEPLPNLYPTEKGRN